MPTTMVLIQALYHDIVDNARQTDDSRDEIHDHCDLSQFMKPSPHSGTLSDKFLPTIRKRVSVGGGENPERKFSAGNIAVFVQSRGRAGRGSCLYSEWHHIAPRAPPRIRNYGCFRCNC